MASTPLLGLSLPADGTTNWGTLVNTSITALLDSAVAGTTTLSSDANVTLTTTTEATNEARQAILLCSGARTDIRTITAPAQSKTYVVINNTTGNFAVKIVGVGPTTGVTVPNGKAYVVAWNGSDFVIVKGGIVDLTTDVTGTLPIANGGTGQVTQQAAINALVGTQTANRVLRSDGTNSTLAQVALATDVSGTLPIANGGTNSTATPTAGGVAYGTGTAYAVTAVGTSGQVLTSNAGAAPTWSTLAANVSSISFASTGLTPATASSGAVTVGGTLNISNGGTGTSTAQGAMNAFAGAVTSGQYLRGNGTNVTMSTIQVADVPTLNQNTSGTAAGLSSTLAVGSGGTGQTTYTDGQLLIGNSTGNTLTKATLTASTGVSVTNGSGAITITNTAPDQVVSLTGAGATTISGTYPNFTISSTNTTYSTATQTVNGLIKLGSNTAQSTAANAVTSTASRTYALQLNASGEAGVNVPWTDTTYGTATTTVNGLIKLGDGTVQTTAANAVSADASRTYAIQLNASGQAVVNVPWASGSGTITGVTATSPVASSGGTAPVISLSANYGDTLNPYASKTANFVLAAPNGSAGAPTFRALVAADIPTLNQNTSGTAGGIAGGTAGQILYQTGVGTTGFISTGSAGQLLVYSGGGFYGWASKTSLNTASTIVERDASGNFSAGTITATLSGNASTSTTATNATNAYISLDTSSATAQYLTFASGLIGNYGLRGASTDLTYTPSTKTLNVAGTVTTTTQTAGDNSTKVATTAFVQTAIGSTGATGTRGQAFTSNGTFTIPTGVTALKITVVGGGGGGGTGVAGTCSVYSSGSGGGGGGTAQSFLTGLTPGNTLSVTIGGAGAIQSAGGNSTVTSGTQTISTITGGGGTGSAGGGANGGVGGTATGGTINSVGGAGSSGAVAINFFPTGGTGGSSRYGGGGTGGVIAAGSAGGLYGGGGGGGSGNNGSGAAGAAGVVIFEW